ncbi:MAG: hypothetical protein M1838_004239 [Thelocarpon superellum]|nr:MAG: hypothetical protein M1838_004239 [Thelocarpon superellum]
MSMLESVASLRAIVRASPAFHRVYAETRPECLKLVLYRAIGPEELPYALGALRASMVQDPRRPLPLPRFFVRDRRSDADNANVWGPFICRSGRWRTVAPAYLVTLLRMASCVDFFVHSFVRTSARAVSSHLQITVAQRLYQFQLCCIFAAREWIPIRAGAVGITNRYFSYQLGRDSAAHMETISMFLVTRIEPVLARVLCEWTEGRPGPWSRFHDFPDFTQPGPDAEDFKRALVLQGLPRLRLFITTPDDRKRQCMILETLVALWGHRMNPPLAEITV